MGTAGEWELLRVVGEGVSGVVHEARHARKGNTAAVKVVDLEVLNRVFFDLIQCDIPISSLHASIQREIKVLSVLHHVNIIALEDSFTIDNRVYICMEFVEGKDLLSAIPPNGYPESIAKNLFFQLGSAVSYCRLANVIHGDIKPDNILVRKKDNQIKLIDFGFAQICKPGVKPEKLGGTLLYSPPFDNPFSYAWDDWSCGVVLYAMLVCRLPFNENDLKSGKGLVLNIPEELSDDVCEVLVSLLDPDQHSRKSVSDILCMSKWMQSERDRAMEYLSPIKRNLSIGADVAPEEARAVLDDVLNPHKVERNSAEDILCTSELLLQKKLSEMVDLQTAEKEAATRAEKRGETEFLQTFPKMPIPRPAIQRQISTLPLQPTDKKKGLINRFFNKKFVTSSKQLLKESTVGQKTPRNMEKSMDNLLIDSINTAAAPDTPQKTSRTPKSKKTPRTPEKKKPLKRSSPPLESSASPVLDGELELRLTTDTAMMSSRNRRNTFTNNQKEKRLSFHLNMTRFWNKGDPKHESLETAMLSPRSPRSKKAELFKERTDSNSNLLGLPNARPNPSPTPILLNTSENQMTSVGRTWPLRGVLRSEEEYLDALVGVMQLKEIVTGRELLSDTQAKTLFPQSLSQLVQVHDKILVTLSELQYRADELTLCIERLMCIMASDSFRDAYVSYMRHNRHSISQLRTLSVSETHSLLFSLCGSTTLAKHLCEPLKRIGEYLSLFSVLLSDSRLSEEGQRNVSSILLGLSDLQFQCSVEFAKI